VETRARAVEPSVVPLTRLLPMSGRATDRKGREWGMGETSVTYMREMSSRLGDSAYVISIASIYLLAREAFRSSVQVDACAFILHANLPPNGLACKRRLPHSLNK
jgi:hypothetical protein